MHLNFRQMAKDLGQDCVDAFNLPKRFRKIGHSWRDFSRKIRGKSTSSSSYLNIESSARHAVGNTGFHRAYPSLGVRGYGK